jgi:5-amino-6-(5-phosphoribosylamino)uracil reductase/diaminohydroxyphosphoribosylaminopyrimidine deaminase/5-amino-6-(5-phosphoribosylamino)uracil reductase
MIDRAARSSRDLIEGPVKRPSVTVKFAQTLDGRIATASGDGARKISGSDSLQLAHQLRADHQAILVGVGTVIADDPLLTVRLVAGRNPVRVVVDSHARVPVNAALLNDQAPGNTLIAHTDRAPRERLDALQRLGVKTLCVAEDEDRRVDLAALLDALRERGVETLMVEGGAQITTQLLRRQLVDRLVVCVAPKLIGEGLNSIGDLKINRLDQALTFRDLTVRQVGADVIFDGSLENVPQDASPSASK